MTDPARGESTPTASAAATHPTGPTVPTVPTVPTGTTVPTGPASLWACTPAPPEQPRQAIVLIHGVGDQVPMRTLRSFTAGIGARRLFSSPDRVTDSGELRRLSEPPSPHLGAHTDYFELYWAHLAPDSDWRTSAGWVLRLLLRRRWWRTPGPAARVVVGFQLVVWAALALLVWGFARSVSSPSVAGVLDAFTRWQVTTGLVLSVLGVLVGRYLRRYLSDAARYLTPRPANIAAREAIRDEGLTLLRQLHAGRYRRVVVVGHSLGSVIGYDLLRGLWDELRHPDPTLAGDQQQVAAFDAAADRLDPGSAATAQCPQLRAPTLAARAEAPLDVGVRPTGDVTPESLDAYEEAQFALWRASRRDGVPWLITDFVTLGSPLTYAPLLFDEPDEWLGGRPGLRLADQQGLKEVPRCPPIHDELTDSRFYRRRYDVPGGGHRDLWVGHTAAPFGPTRWTNLYLPVRGVLRGDLFAGPVAAHFGPGVRDVPVTLPPPTPRSGVWAAIRAHFPVAHQSYWWAPGGGRSQAPDPVLLPAGDHPREGDARAARPDTITALVSALRRDDILRAP